MGRSTQAPREHIEMLSALNPDKVCFTIQKLRELEAMLEPRSDDSSNETDDQFASALTEENELPVKAELNGFIEAMDIDEITELQALLFVGRGDFDKEEWAAAMEQARTRSGPKPAAYISDMSMAAEYLEEGMAAFDLSCEDFEDGAF
jgi:hypothetical protein